MIISKQQGVLWLDMFGLVAALLIVVVQPISAEPVESSGAAASEAGSSGRPHVLFVLMCQSPQSAYHRERCELLRKHIEDQRRMLPMAADDSQISIVLAEELVDKDVETFYYLPILVKNHTSLSKADFVFFCHEETRMQLSKLLIILSEYNASEPLFLGSPLQDEGLYIVHHFSQSRHLYPFIYCGFAISKTLVASLTAHFHAHKAKMEEYEFRIDPSYELASLITVELQLANLTALPGMCPRAVNITDSCVSWATETFRLPQCAPTSASVAAVLSRTQFAVKTHKANFDTVLQVVKDTWAPLASHIRYYADVEDAEIPTVACGVPNTERGHCDKLNRILHLLAAQLDSPAAADGEKNSSESTGPAAFDWFVICDDDTLLSVPRLASLLACHQSGRQPLILGEKYGYLSADGLRGYAYPTGGSGFALNAAALRQLTAATSVTRCGSAESPDDMSLGVWLRSLGLPLLHSHLLHQARSSDYAPQLLAAQLPVSFHKHLDSDPRLVYGQFLTDQLDKQAAAAAAAAGKDEL